MKKIVLVITISLISLTLVAQQRRVSAYIFQPEWYAGGQIGINNLIAEGFPESFLSKTIGNQTRVFLGYNFTPVFGIKTGLAVAGHKWAGYSGNKPVISFGSQSLNADLVLNLTNSFFGYDLYYRTDFSLFAGGGVIHRNKADFTSDFYSYLLRGGAQLDYRLTQFWDVNLNAELNVTGDKFNDFAGGSNFELVPAVMLGLTYHFRTDKLFGKGCCY